MRTLPRFSLFAAICAALVVGALGIKVALAIFVDAASVPANTFTTSASFPLMRLATGSYAGNGSDNRQITGVGFRPDVLFVKCECGQRAVVRTSTMPGDASKIIGLLGNLLADNVQSLDADGFTIGTDARVNNSGQTFHWVAMKGSSVLTVGSYVGDGTDNRSITGVGFQPVWVMTMGDGEDSWFRPGTLAGDASFAVDGSGTFTNRIQALESDGFQIGSNTNVNQTDITYHYIAWKASAALKQATYAGNGADNRSITGVGFQPQFLWIKRSSTNQSAWRPASLGGDSTLYWSATAAAANRIQALEADGFQVGTNDQVNNSVGTYYYLAIIDSP